MFRLKTKHIFTLFILLIFSGCKIKEFTNNMWENNRYMFLGGIFIFLAIIIVIIKLLKGSKTEDDPDDLSISTEDNADEEQDFTIDEDIDKDEDIDYKTELLDVRSVKTEESVNIEKQVHTNAISISIKGENIGKFDLSEDGTIIGRDPSKANIVISDAIVSKMHLKITPDNDEFIIEDLKSTNGTYIDGEQITKSTISLDNIVFIGKKGNIVIRFIK